MALEHREVVSYDDAGTTRVVTTEPVVATVVDRQETVAYDPYDRRGRSVQRATQAIYLVFGLLESLIAIRFVLRLLGANPDAGFAEFIYGITRGFLAPFNGLFGTPSFEGSVLEIHSIVAIVVYALVAWLIVKVVWLAFGETRTAVTTSSTSVDSTRLR